ncbi:MAG: oligosaccharide flippase family protein [Oscillospiraceae bacterium]|nr:oligosaccharide flippase family protein [Oscillospiraceae bacterium]
MIKFREQYTQIPIRVKVSIWFLICSFLQKGIAVITTPIFTRLMSTDDYGQFGVFSSWMSIVSVLVTLNLFSGMYVRGLVKYEADRRQFSSSLQSLVLLQCIVWTGLYLIFYQYVNAVTSLTTIQTLCMFCLIWTSSAFNFWAAEQRVELHYRSLVLLTLCVSFLKPVLGILLIFRSDDKVTARIIGMAIVELVFFTYCFVDQIYRGKRVYVKQYWKEAFQYNIPLVPHYLSMSVLNGADKIMIERMKGLSESGIYNLAYQISQVMMLFNVALTQTIEPWLYKKINDGETTEIKRIAYPSWVFIAIMNLLLIAFAPEIVYLFAPKAYYDAIWVIAPIAMSVFFIFLYAFFAVFEFYYTKTKLAAIATCTGAVLNIVLNYIFINKYGYYAAGYTTLFCYIVYAMLHYYFMRIITRAGDIYDSKFIFLLSLIFMMSGFLLMLTYKVPILRYGLLIMGVIVAVIKRKVIKDFIATLINTRKAAK